MSGGKAAKLSRLYSSLPTAFFTSTPQLVIPTKEGSIKQTIEEIFFALVGVEVQAMKQSPPTSRDFVGGNCEKQFLNTNNGVNQT